MCWLLRGCPSASPLTRGPSYWGFHKFSWVRQKNQFHSTKFEFLTYLDIDMVWTCLSDPSPLAAIFGNLWRHLVCENWSLIEVPKTSARGSHAQFLESFKNARQAEPRSISGKFQKVCQGDDFQKVPKTSARGSHARLPRNSPYYKSPCLNRSKTQIRIVKLAFFV